MADNDNGSIEPSNPQVSLKGLLLLVTGICVLLALATAFLPRLLGPDTRSILLIVAFVCYPFAMGISAEFICRRVARSYLFCRRLAIALGVIGLVPAVLLNYPRPRVYMVAPIAGLVLVLCFAATGAFIGSLVDLRNRYNSD
ncbi:hypothetical protein HG15A2_15510 [Adhaeretor mobilis]|uniref:Uncharacterized protein n=1 Tax=Adhaeretor mobilis TaxID=1930276 RepID=A0A517MTR8_9BACT|nr:hypothetical protein HG15A2_15510 [Adhaeretor mobilis]